MIDTPSHAIELLGGAKAVADQIKRPVTTVSSWSARGAIPVNAWPKLIELARTLGVEGFTYEAMALAHAKDRTTAPSEAA